MLKRLSSEIAPLDKTQIYQTKQQEILSLTNELHSHYFMDKHFVDPDKTFHILLQKIIVSVLISTLTTFHIIVLFR